MVGGIGEAANGRFLSTKKGGKSGSEKGLKKPETEALYNFYHAATESLRYVC